METIENRAKRLVEQNVQACMSSLVSTLAQSAGSFGAIDRHTMRQQSDSVSALSDLAEQAAELASPVPDYEEAAIQLGYKCEKRPDGSFYVSLDKDGERVWGVGCATAAEAWQATCEGEDIDPYDREVYEHWAVSPYLAELLQAVGEKVDTDFASLCVWARTTTGQMICMDSCIEDCVREADRRYAEACLPSRAEAVELATNAFDGV